MRPSTPALGAFLEGWRRAALAPYLVLGILALTIVVSLPLAAALHRALRSDLGSSAFADELVGEWNDNWASTISTGSAGVVETFTHEILGFGGTLAMLDRAVNGRALEAPLGIAVAIYLACWIFLTGGVIDRLARGRPRGPRHFFSTSLRFFWRAARLGLFTGAAYWMLARWVHPLIFGVLVPFVSDEASPEPRLIVWRAIGYVAFLAVMAALTLVADFARVRLVVEDRRSVIGALVASARFIRRRPWRTSWLFLLNVLALAVVARLWLQIAPGAGAPTWTAVVAGQAYLVARIVGRLGFIGSEVVFLQGELAHATYIAAPASPWPRSVSVDALRRGSAVGEQGPTGRVG